MKFQLPILSHFRDIAVLVETIIFKWSGKPNFEANTTQHNRHFWHHDHIFQILDGLVQPPDRCVAHLQLVQRWKVHQGQSRLSRHPQGHTVKSALNSVEPVNQGPQKKRSHLLNEA